jgi:hypothetical protein
MQFRINAVSGKIEGDGIDFFAKFLSCFRSEDLYCMAQYGYDFQSS